MRLVPAPGCCRPSWPSASRCPRRAAAQSTGGATAPAAAAGHRVALVAAPHALLGRDDAS